MPDFKFLVATQEDKGLHLATRGATQAIRSHTATVVHARRRSRPVKEQRVVHREQHHNGATPLTNHWKLSTRRLSHSTSGSSNNDENDASFGPLRLDLVPEAEREKIQNSVNTVQLTVVSPQPDGLRSAFEAGCSQEPPFDNQSPVTAPTDGSYEKDLANRTEQLKLLSPKSERSMSFASAVPPIAHNPTQQGLDPFLKLAVNLDVNEINHLQFFFQDGIAIRFGARPNTNSAWNPTALLAPQKFLETCPVFVLSRVLWSEHFFCQAQNRDLSPEFYKGLSKIYRVASDVLANESSLELRLSAILNLQEMELAFGREDLQTLHLYAFERLLGNENLASLFLNKKLDLSFLPVMSTMAAYFAGGFMFRASERDKVAKASRTVLHAQHAILHWLTEHNAQVEELRAQNPDLTQNQEPSSDPPTLHILHHYLTYLMDHYFNERPPSAQAVDHHQERKAAAIMLLFHFVVTPTELSLNSYQTLRLLQAWEKCMIQLTQPTSSPRSDETTLISLHPAVALATFIYIRRGQGNEPSSRFDFPTSEAQEIKLCTSAVHAVQTVCLHSEDLMQFLFRSLTHDVISVARGDLADKFTIECIHRTSVEIEENWRRTVEVQSGEMVVNST